MKLDIGIGGNTGAFLIIRIFLKGGITLLDIYTVSFFGHREINSFKEIENILENLIHKLITEHEYVEFLIGRNGEFDQLVSSVIHRVRKRLEYKNCSLTLVLPYMTAEFRDNDNSFYDYYDEIEISQSASRGHFTSAMQTRNKEMVDRSDLIVFYVERQSGGAYTTMKYAVNNEKEIFNVSNALEVFDRIRQSNTYRN